MAKIHVHVPVFFCELNVHVNSHHLLQKLEELEKEEELREAAGLYDSEPVSESGQIVSFTYSGYTREISF